ncbi:TIGR02757 family protein [Reichenbachiella sp. MALMAid0571]|uniref:TIGR02757 family protein n=1 Tax=Reichenbachiella sp. MALMAid0571 TaxID=3143939 RepID=UPI0032DFFBCF
MIDSNELKSFLDQKVEEFNNPSFIKDDPICIPHQFSKKQDIEIAGFFASILAWGQRKTIINKCNELMQLMDNSPHDFIASHEDTDLKRLLSFKHRTFNATDTLYFIEKLKHHYHQHDSLEMAFISASNNNDFEMKSALIHFRNYFFDLPDFPQRTKKHISTPANKSACKRLNMFLRWMARNDKNGVDFGIWKNIPTSALICPCDVHVDRIARKLGLITRKQTDWQTAEELTQNLQKFDPNDPVKYDFALFGLGVIEKF